MALTTVVATAGEAGGVWLGLWLGLWLCWLWLWLKLWLSRSDAAGGATRATAGVAVAVALSRADAAGGATRATAGVAVAVASVVTALGAGRPVSGNWELCEFLVNLRNVCAPFFSIFKM